MSDVIPRSSEDGEGLKEHGLLRIIELMNQVSAAQGLDNKIGVLLSNLHELVGGTNTCLYYLADDELHYADVLGQRRKIDRIEDDLVQRVFASHEVVEQACARVLPLGMGGQLSGVIKLENVPPGLGDLLGQLPLLFTHVATVLNHELACQSKLARAYARLNKAEEELRKSEARFLSYFELPLHGVAITSPEKAWIHVNQRLCSILGYSRSEIVQLTWSEMTHPDDLAENVGQFERVLSGHIDQYQLEKRFIHKDGHEIWTRLVAGCVRKSDGTVDCMVALVEDITERKRMEEALVEANERLMLAQRSAGAGTWDWDLTTGRLNWSPELFRLFGLEALAAPTLDLWRSVLHPDDRQGAEERMNEAIQSRLPMQNEYRIVLPTGEVRWISALGDTIRDERGQVLRMSGICTDITSRKQAEEHLRITLESIEDGFFACDREWRFVYVNAPAERMLGIRSEEVLGKSLWEVFPATVGTPLELNYRRAAAGESRDFDNFYEPWGRWFHNRCFPREDGGMAVYFQDISERKRLELERETLEAQNRQLQKADSLGRMAGAIAHHFNNQLSVVMGNLELALSNLPHNTDLFETLSGAMLGAQRAAEVSGGMLTYLGQTVGKREFLDLSEFCGHNLSLLKSAMPKGVELESAFPSPGPVVSANANQLHQLLTNLVTNAWEASSGLGGVVRLSASQAAPAEIADRQRFPIDSPLRHNAYACLEVADSGCGIASEDIEKLFDPFFSTKFTGRGLGLAVVIGIVRAHEGVITVNSEPGGGSTFRVYLPLMSEGIPRRPVPVIVPARNQGGGTVLLVEDEDAIRRLAAKMLKNLGFTVLTASHGVEALEVFRQHPEEIHCVVCDLMMPHMDGWETLNALRKIAPGIAVVLSSGYSEEQVMVGDHPEMPQAFVCKPFLQVQLGEAIRKALIVGL